VDYRYTQTEIRDDCLVITIDNPPVNIVDPPIPRELQRRVAAAHGDFSLIMIRGAGKGTVAGVDLAKIETIAEGIARGISEANRCFETSRTPVVWFLQGHTLGGALELALACHYRIATPVARIALPEVTYGFPPGAGGTQRLPRLVGVDAALPMITTGKRIDAGAAHALGCVDALVDERADLTDALRSARALIDNGKAPSLACRLDARIGDPDVFAKARASLDHGAQNAGATAAAINCVEAATSMPFDEAIDFELDQFLHWVGTPNSRALRDRFFAERIRN